MPGNAFDDPRYLTAADTDAVLRVALEVASELWVLRDRFVVLEELLEEHGSVSRNQLDTAQPGPEAKERLAQERQQFLDRLVAALTPERDSSTPKPSAPRQESGGAS